MRGSREARRGAASRSNQAWSGSSHCNGKARRNHDHGSAEGAREIQCVKRRTELLSGKRSGVKTLLAVEYGDANGMCRGPSAIKGKLDTPQLQSHLPYCVYWSLRLHHVHASNPIRTTFRFTVHFLKAKRYIPTRCVRHSRLRSRHHLQQRYIHQSSMDQLHVQGKLLSDSCCLLLPYVVAFLGLNRLSATSATVYSVQ